MYEKHAKELTEELIEQQESGHKAQNENQELLLRLSKVTGDKLIANNPNITNLGDPNRPTKLGETISELYDNEWTDALEGLQTQGRNERNAIWILFETLMDVTAFCKDYSSRLFALPENAVKYSSQDTSAHCCLKTISNRSRSVDVLIQSSDQPMTGEEVKQWRENFKPFLYWEWFGKKREEREERKERELENDNQHLSTKEDLEEETKQRIEHFQQKLQALKSEFSKQTHALQKEFSDVLTQEIEKDYLKTRWNELRISELKPYIKRCIFIAWMMCMQSPPMAIAQVPRAGDRFDSSLYRAYTKTGPCVDFIVWPAILLHENGPVISKGIAQGKTF